MFCGNCGQQNPDGSVFCSNCGASLQAAPAVDTPAPGFTSDFAGSTAPKGLDNKMIKLIGAAAGGVVALILIIVLLVNVLSGGEAKPVKTFLTGLQKCNVEKMLSVFPDAIMDEYDLDKSEIKDLQEDLEDVMDDEDIEVSYEIRDSKDMKNSALRDLQEWYDDQFDLEVTDAMTVKAKITAEVDGEKEKDTIEFTVVKIKGKWYMDVYNNDMFYSFIGGYMF